MPDVQGMDRDACSRRFAQLFEGIPFYTNAVMTETLQTGGRAAEINPAALEKPVKGLEIDHFFSFATGLVRGSAIIHQ